MPKALPSKELDAQIGANICSIERGSTIDGPGLRYVVFLTKCPFRCKFCHNPESWATPNAFPFMSVAELLSNINRLADFLRLSKGGVTISGGEPTLHKDFLLELFKGLKALNIHTAIDTCGYTEIDDKMHAITELCDLFLVDVKHIYEDEHRLLTSRSRTKILEFLRYITAKRKDIIIRVVMHSAQVNSLKYAEELALYLGDFKRQIKYIELLPYHSMGAEKWKELNLDYDDSNFSTPSKEQVQLYAQVLEKAGYKTKY